MRVLVGILLLAACQGIEGGTGLSTNPGADDAALTVTGTSPADGAVDISTATTVVATLSGPVDPVTVTPSGLVLATAGGATVTGTVATAFQAITFTPDAPLALGTAYVATLGTSITDSAGVGLAAPFSWTFTTAP